VDLGLGDAQDRGIVLLTALVLAVSALSYRIIERPFLVRKARLDT
jgi:peptidoglycan/LPS O-acetylase OafA/YrhL